MAKLNFGLGPWGAFGSLGEGFTEGIRAGTLMRRQRAEEGWQHDEEERKRLNQALAMLVAGGKAEDPGIVDSINQLLRQSKVGGGVQIPPYDPQARAKRGAETAGADVAARLEQAKVMGLQPGSPEWYNFVHQFQPAKTGREFREIDVPGFGPIPLDKAYHYLPRPGGGGSGGRGGDPMKGKIPWRGPNGEFLGYHDKDKPPSKDAVPGTAGGFKPPQPKTVPVGIMQDMMKINEALQADPTDQKAINKLNVILRTFPELLQRGEETTEVQPGIIGWAFGKKPGQQKVPIAQRRKGVGIGDVPTAPAQTQDDEYGPEIER